MTAALVGHVVEVEGAPEMCDEASLVRAALGGDGGAFAALVRPHLGLLYRVAGRACGDAALAEDAVQETLAAAFDSLSRFEVGTSLRAYLAAVAVRRAHTLLRGERRRRAREDRAGSPSATTATPEEEAQAAATGRLIRDALAAMPEKRRAAALLRLDGGLDYGDIARAVGASPGSARVLVHEALKDLRAALGRAGGE